MKIFGLIGQSLSHSFSQNYFNSFFSQNKLHDHIYINFEINTPGELADILKSFPELKGLNVTIPYKTAIIPYLDDLDPLAKEINAVNCIKINQENNSIMGYNTDYTGFKNALLSFINADVKNALILGTGGVSKAVKKVLDDLGINAQFVSGTQEQALRYGDLKGKLSHYQLIINCTPLGTFPEINACPDIPYEELSSKHYLFDMVYNPTESLFLKKGLERGCSGKNGHEMLELQAKASWEIWRSFL